MHLFTIREGVTKGLSVCRDESTPYLAQSTYSAVVLALGDDLTRFVRSLPAGEVWLNEAEVELGKAQGLTMIMLDSGMPPSRQALVRVETMAGEGGHVALLPPARTDFRSGSPQQKYHPFPPAGVQFLGSEEDAFAAHNGIYPEMDALLILNDGGQFRIERTGDTRDQHGAHAPEVFNVRWDGKRRELTMSPEVLEFGPDGKGRRVPTRYAKARPAAWGTVTHAAKAPPQQVSVSQATAN